MLLLGTLASNKKNGLLHLVLMPFFLFLRLVTLQQLIEKSCCLQNTHVGEPVLTFATNDCGFLGDVPWARKK